jgi:hypothetical protein
LRKFELPTKGVQTSRLNDNMASAMHATNEVREANEYTSRLRANRASAFHATNEVREADE